MTKLGPLPKEWRVVRLGEVVTRAFGGGTPSTSNPDFWGGTIPWTTSAVIQNDDVELCAFQRRITEEGLRNSSTSLAPKGSLLVGTRVGVGKAAVATFDVAISQDLTALILDQHVDAYFVAYLLKSRWYQSWFENNKRGATIKGVPRQDLLKLPIPLPPLPEQRAIAHVLRTVQRAKEATEGVIAALKELKKSLMQHLFTYGPVPVTERERVPLQETEIGPIPAHWRVVRLGEVAKLRTGPFGSLLHASDYVEGGIPFVMPKDLSSTGQIIPHSIARIKQDDRNRLNNYLLQVGDIILGRRGEIGRRALVTKKEEGWVCGSGCLRIRPNDKLYPLYLSYLFEIEVVRCYLSSEAIGTTMANLNTQILSRLPIPLPPLDEQREIARMLQAVDTRIAAEQARRAALEELFKSLLHELMSGRIRVPNIVGGQRSRDSAPDADPLPESED
jgi:type I restriction enzyme S subunit